MRDHCHAKLVVRLVSLSIIMTTFLHAKTLAFRSVMSTARSIQVCTNTTCRKAGSLGTLDLFRALAPPGVEVKEGGCQGRCGLGPNVLATPSKEVYNGVLKPATAAAIVEIDFAASVPDAVVSAFDRVSEGDALYARGLHAEALACYSKCIAQGGLDGSPHALSVAKLKQSSAAWMAARKRPGKGGVSVTFEDAEASALESIQLWRSYAPAWLHLSNVLADSGRLEEALETLAILSKEFPEAKRKASEKAARIRRR